jgi:hypothetical protein
VRRLAVKGPPFDESPRPGRVPHRTAERTATEDSAVRARTGKEA